MINMIRKLSFTIACLVWAARGERLTANDEELIMVETDKCTTIVVGPEAGIDGPMATYTADCKDCDFRIGKVPAQDWKKGTERPFFLYKSDYPATVTKIRGETWHPDNLQGNKEQLKKWSKESTITGYIPEVEHTYALLEAGYGIMNEHQVGLGESTCASKLWAAPTSAGGKAQVEIRELSKLALERTKTAREAIQLMGDIAVQYGFYAADWSGGDASKGEGGEALTVIDKKEAWVFHVTSDDTGASAVWVAQRLEPNHVAVVANQFVIREIDPGSDNFMFSHNLYEVAIRTGFWDPSTGPLNFVHAFAPKRAHGVYGSRRVWRVFSKVAPSINLPADTNSYADDYPFSVPVDKKLSYEDMIKLNSDHYEGSQFDLTKGLAAGPYGDPQRYDIALVDNLTFPEVMQGGYERAISMFRTSYSTVAQARNVPDELGRVWVSVYAPSSSSYLPFYVAADKLPKAYTRGSLYEYDNSVAYWNFLAAGNYASRFYKFAMVEVGNLKKKLLQKFSKSVDEVEVEAIKILEKDKKGAKDDIVDLLTHQMKESADELISEWQDLLPRLITRFHDGMIFSNMDQPTFTIKKMFYPVWWLNATGYFDNHATHGPDVILFEPSPDSFNPATSPQYSSFFPGVEWLLLLTCVFSCVGTVVFMKVYEKYSEKQVFKSPISGYRFIRVFVSELTGFLCKLVETIIVINERK